MSNVFCLCGFRIGAMEINMRLRGAVASLARHSQNHGIGVDPIHMPLFVFHARGMARNARNFYRTCERCHGPAEAHVDFHRANPKATQAKHITHPNHLSRERMNDICGQCHSGSANFLKSPFSFRPGDHLDEFLRVDEKPHQFGAGVHTANQLPRLKRSQCYIQSDSMNCSTCHNPHQNERGNVALFSKRCMECHAAQDCGQFPISGEQISKNCIDCHMPKHLDETTKIETSDDSIFPEVRDHFIRIDAETTRIYLESTSQNK